MVTYVARPGGLALKGASIKRFDAVQFIQRPDDVVAVPQRFGVTAAISPALYHAQSLSAPEAATLISQTIRLIVTKEAGVLAISATG